MVLNQPIRCSPCRWWPIWETVAWREVVKICCLMASKVGPWFVRKSDHFLFFSVWNSKPIHIHIYIYSRNWLGSNFVGTDLLISFLFQFCLSSHRIEPSSWSREATFWGKPRHRSMKQINETDQWTLHPYHPHMVCLMYFSRWMDDDFWWMYIEYADDGWQLGQLSPQFSGHGILVTTLYRCFGLLNTQFCSIHINPYHC